ncbi:MAG: DUF971 domain-containing protein [Sulfuriferula sp.]|nr:DUF971 domain-containing protein [Sulfuriferula sp.]
MAGLDKNTPIPTEIKLHQSSRILEVAFNEGSIFKFSDEFLRVFSPSAEVRGHGHGQEVMQVGKQDVTITGIEPVGNYAIKPSFSDGHDTGIYSWDYLFEIGQHQDMLWARYLQQLSDAGASRSAL